MKTTTHSLSQTLIADGPHKSLGDHANTFNRLIGSWVGEYYDPNPDGIETGPMEVHFSWALQGRAVQDTWIAPTINSTKEERSRLKRDMYGSTLRVFDQNTGVWRSEWFDPGKGIHFTLVGRSVNGDIIQVGFWDDRPQRWRFHSITDKAFQWEAHSLEDDGETWRLVTKFSLKRVIS